MKKKISMILMSLMVLGAAAGCGSKNGAENAAAEIVTAPETTAAKISYTDALGNTIVFEAEEIEKIRSGEEKVAVVNGSFAEIWSVAGGKLGAVTDDAYDEGRELSIGDTTVNIGAMKNPSLETLLAADIKLAILNAETKGHVSMQEALEAAGIRTVFHSVETFDDYLSVLKFYTELTGREDCYEQYGEKVQEKIAEQIARQDDSHPTVLLIRAFSTGAKAKGSDNMTGIMLKELGCENIADSEGRLLDDLSMEVILERDPDYIFVTTMGADDQAALDSVKTLLQDNPAWNSLSAVVNDRYYVLPKNMFHNKPNQRWAESYKMLADYLYPESSADEKEQE